MLEAVVRTVRTFLWHTALCACVVAAPQEELASKSQREAIAKIRLELASLGQRDAVVGLRRSLRNLGAKSDELEESDGACTKALAKRRAPKAVPKRVVMSIEKIVDDLGSRLNELEGDSKIQLAFEVLAFDSRHAAANAVLGRERVEVDGRIFWWDEEDKKREARRDEIRAAVLTAKRFDPEIEVETSTHEVLEGLGEKDCLRLRFENLSFFTVLEEKRAVAILRDAMRAAAFGEWLISGRSEVERAESGYTWVLVDGDDYAAVVDSAAKSKGIDPKNAPHAKRWASFHDRRGWEVLRHEDDEYVKTLCVVDLLWGRRMPPFLRAGLCNWSCEAVIGAKMPDIVQVETEHVDGTKASMLRLTGGIDPATYRRAGTYGTREWMSWLVQQGSAPSIVECFTAQMGDLRGKELVKSTLVVEHWAESGPILELLRPLARGHIKDGVFQAGADYVPYFERATELTIAEFESDFRRWLLGPPPSLLECCSLEEEYEFDKEATKALEDWNDLRKRAFGGELMKTVFTVPDLAARPALHLHPDLCRATAVLAKKVIEQVRRGERVGFDLEEDQGMRELLMVGPRGRWGVAPPLVDFATSVPADSFEEWLANPYTRRAILDPDLLAVGWARDKDVAVADAASLVDVDVDSSKSDTMWALPWPSPDARGVPRSLGRVGPSPLPGTDPADLGLVISLHVGAGIPSGAEFGVAMEARLDKTDGDLLDCHFSTPSAPTNPEWAPPRYWFLIPKEPFPRGRTIHVTAKLTGRNNKTLRWSFRT
ncbi:MAG: hypothetical protein KDC95_12380 [Planctomycetes bacterium]|nr:hypothetical protein [Planctomycetota bacterium]